MSTGLPKRGPRLLAWWEDSYGRTYQFVQQDDYFALRSQDEGSNEWIYSGSWISDTEQYGSTVMNEGRND